MRLFSLRLLCFIITSMSAPGLVLANKTDITPARPGTAYIAIIIDDLGHDLRNGKRALSLAGPVSFAVLPHTKYGRRLASSAHRKNKEVLLHQPMQSIGHEDPGPGKLVSGMSDLEITLTLENNLKTVPFAIGINNHMGSLLTQQSREMAAVMVTLQKHGKLFFVDSLTTPKSVATDMATLFKIPYVSRNIFLDSDRNSKFINNQFDKLLKIAKKRGVGLAIGHPYNETLVMLENRLPSLTARGIELISVSELLNKKYRDKEL